MVGEKLGSFRIEDTLGVGAMGQASSHALGLALGRPDKRVIVLDGDGSLLMNLGSLVSIAEAAPGWRRPNLEAALEYEQANANRKGAIAALESALAEKESHGWRTRKASGRRGTVATRTRRCSASRCSPARTSAPG